MFPVKHSQSRVTSHQSPKLLIQLFQFHHSVIHHIEVDIVRLYAHVLGMKAILYQFVRMFRVDTNICQAMGQIDGFREVVNLISFFNLSIHGEHHLQAVIDHRAVKMVALVGRAGVAVVNGMGQAGI